MSADKETTSAPIPGHEIEFFNAADDLLQQNLLAGRGDKIEYFKDVHFPSPPHRA